MIKRKPPKRFCGSWRDWYEGGFDHRRERLQRRRWDSGGFEDLPHAWSVWDERGHGADRPEHHRCVWGSGAGAGIFGQPAGLRVPGYFPGRRKNWHDALRSGGAGHSGEAAAVSTRPYRHRPGDGLHQRALAHERSSGGGGAAGAISAGGGAHAQPAGGGSAHWTSHHQPRRHGSGGGGAVPALRLRHPAQGWAPGDGCR